MRNILAAAAIALALLSPGAAFAVQFYTVDLVADCNGWTSNVEIWFREGYTDASLQYAAVVIDAAGFEVERFEDSVAFPVGNSGVVTYTYAGTFSTPPQSGWLVSVEYVLNDNFVDGFNRFEEVVTAAPDCAGDPGAPLCCRTADWWRRNPDAWPATSLTVGGAVLDAAALQRALNRRAWGQPALLLTRQLVAAEFNALANGDASMDPALKSADAWLVAHASRGRGPGGDQETAAALAEPLLAYNGLGCAGDGAAAAGEIAQDRAALEKALPTEAVGFGELKARYR